MMLEDWDVEARWREMRRQDAASEWKLVSVLQVGLIASILIIIALLALIFALTSAGPAPCGVPGSG